MRHGRRRGDLFHLLGYYEVILSLPCIQKQDGVRIPTENNAPRTWNCYKLQIRGTAGSKVTLCYTGHRDKKFNNGNWLVAKEFLLDGSDQTLIHRLEIPSDVTDFGLRLDLKNAGVFTFQAPDFYTEPKEAQEFPAVNYIFNGGAENGFDNTIYLPVKNRAHISCDKFINYKGGMEDFLVELSRDDQVRRSGKYSFCINFKGEGNMTSRVDSFAFNPVPIIPDAPYTYTIYAKAERKCRVDLGLYLGAGNGEGRSFQVGTEWTKLQFHVPSWTKTRIYAQSGMITPTFVAPPNTKVWFDDACVTIGPHKEVSDNRYLFFREGKLNKPNHYYFPGDSLKVALALEQLQNAPLKGAMEWEILNFTGKSIYKKSLGKRTLPANQVIAENFTVDIPGHLRGPHNLVCTFREENGKVHQRTFYFGVVEKEGKYAQRVALETPGGHNIRLVAPFYKLFGIGTARIGSASTRDVGLACENAKVLSEAGVRVLLNYSPPPTIKFNMNDEQMVEEFLEGFRNTLKKYAPYLSIVESWNEANLATSAGMTVQRNAWLIKRMKEVIQETAPHIKLAGPNPCTTDFAWIQGVLEAGAYKHLDIVSEHPYRKLPESPDYGDDALAVRKIIEKYRPGMPYWATESGRQYPSTLPDNRLYEQINIDTARDIRNMLLGYGSGLDCYVQFLISSWSVANSMNALFMGNRTTDGALIPAPILYAIRGLVDRLDTGKPAGRVTLGYQYRGILFDKGNAGSVCALWKFSGEKAQFKLNPKDCATTVIYDMFGSTLDNTQAFDVSEYPVYLEVKGAPQQLKDVLKRASKHSADGNVLEATAQPIDPRQVRISLKNTGIAPAENVVVVVENSQLVEGESSFGVGNIDVEQSKECVFKLKQPVSLAKSTLPLKIYATSRATRLNVNLQALMIPKSKEPLKIDGDLSDWKQWVEAKLDHTNAVVMEKQLWGESQRKINAKLRYSWDDNYFYIAAELYKNSFSESPASAPLSAIWFSDSLQVCFDPLHNGLPTDKAFMDDDFEYSLGVTQGEAIVYRRTGSSSIYDSLPKPPGKITEVKFAVKREAGKISYEAAFPRQSVSPFKLKPYSLGRTSSIINLVEDGKRLGYLELTPGIGDVKSPGQWMDVVLLP